MESVCRLPALPLERRLLSLYHLKKSFAQGWSAPEISDSTGITVGRLRDIYKELDPGLDCIGSLASCSIFIGPTLKLMPDEDALKRFSSMFLKGDADDEDQSHSSDEDSGWILARG